METRVTGVQSTLLTIIINPTRRSTYYGRYIPSGPLEMGISGYDAAVMSRQTRFIAAFLAGLAILALVAVWFVMGRGQPPAAGWPPSERAAFMRSCLEQCRTSPGVTEDRYPLCQSACTCAADEGEKTMTVQELASAAQAISSGKASAEQTAMMDRLKAAGMRCSTGTAPAQK